VWHAPKDHILQKHHPKSYKSNHLNANYLELGDTVTLPVCNFAARAFHCAIPGFKLGQFMMLCGAHGGMGTVFWVQVLLFSFYSAVPQILFTN
jgi:hypothetical protein